MNNASDQYAARYGHCVHDLARLLPEMGAGLQAQLCDLHRFQTPERAERLAIALEGAKRHVMRFREALQQGATGNGEPPTV